MPEMEYLELQMLLDELGDGLKYGRLSEAVTALGILNIYIDGLVKEEERWNVTERKIIEERRAV